FFRPQTFAHGTGPVGAVETERTGLQFFVTDLAVRAGVERAEDQIFPYARIGLVGIANLVTDQQGSAAVRNRQVDRLSQALVDPLTNDDAIDDRFDRVIFSRGKFRGLAADIEHFAIDAGTLKTRFADLLENIEVLTFAA